MHNRDLLLSFLSDKQGEWVSGASLSRQFGLTRSAVWKHICRLRQDGYVIESSPGKGYLLKQAPDKLFPEEIRRTLKTNVFGRGEILYLPKTGSTNTVAKSMAAEGAPEGTLVIAEEQTEGRGRRERTWYSPPREGLYASLVLRPCLSPSRAAGVTMMASIALARVLLNLGLKVRMKWPNDILLNGKKVAGMLVEMAADLDAVDYMVIGLGLNVHTKVFPPDLDRSATSLWLETRRVFSRTEVLASYLGAFETAYSSSQTGDSPAYFEEWKALTDILGRRVSIRLLDRTCSGIVQDMDTEGALILKDDLGVLHRVFSGDLIRS